MTVKKIEALDAIAGDVKGMELSVVPCGYWVILKPLHAEKTKGGIILPNLETATHKWAKVIAVGDGECTADGVAVKIPLKEGDLVCYQPKDAKSITLHSVNLIAINYREVFFALRGGDGRVLATHE